MDSAHSGWRYNFKSIFGAVTSINWFHSVKCIVGGLCLGICAPILSACYWSHEIKAPITRADGMALSLTSHQNFPLQGDILLTGVPTSSIEKLPDPSHYTYIQQSYSKHMIYKRSAKLCQCSWETEWRNVCNRAAEMLKQRGRRRHR